MGKDEPKKEAPQQEGDWAFLDRMFQVSMAIGFVGVFTYMAMYPTEDKTIAQMDRVFKKDELALHDGTDTSLPLLLALLGKVYDVTKGAKHYQKGGGYNFFCGKDGTKAFVTGEFNEEGLVESTDGLTAANVLDIVDWQDFYEKDYSLVGVVEGLYYDSAGQPTSALTEVHALAEQGRKEKAAAEDLRRILPPCNIRGAPGTQSVVWCTKKSGGIDRDWVGVPREFFHTKQNGKRCACVNEETMETYKYGLLEYPDCPPTAVECTLPL